MFGIMEHYSKKLFLSAIKITFPVLLGYIPLGIAFGFLLTGAGYHWSYSFLMSVLIYAGSVQFISVALLAAGAGLMEFLTLTLLINLRHSFYGISMLEKFSDVGRFRTYLIFALTDETYALLTTTKVPDRASKSDFYLYIAILNHFYWITGSVIGAILGSVLEIDMEGMAFVLTALFVVLTIEQYYHSKAVFPFIAAIVAGVVSIVLFSPQNMLLASIIIGTLILLSHEKMVQAKRTSALMADTDQEDGL